ncbi:hypothetical protein [Rickettsia argasii]|uniref:Uncharacterized protein n=1 Tax=Rickettsia argasii T170-B TaxID=1268837 RepID=A0A0F3RCN8_9RICK|nr:hypothetical protein [Rickettsia argasii]KJW04190.1 hypothetical protein RAT170B_1328 [Rickettsia argasii T170-B]
MFNWVYNKIFSYPSPNIESLRKALEERIDFFSPPSKDLEELENNKGLEKRLKAVKKHWHIYRQTLVILV